MPDDDPEPIDKGKGREDPPPGNNDPDDDPDNDPQDDDEEDGKKFSKSSYWPSTTRFRTPPSQDPRPRGLRWQRPSEVMHLLLTMHA